MLLFIKRNWLAVFAFISFSILGISYYLFLSYTEKATVISEIKNYDAVSIGVVVSAAKPAEYYRPLIDYLNAYSKVKWTLDPMRDYGTLVDEFYQDHLQAVIAGSGPGYRLITYANSVPVARMEKNGLSTYKGYIIVKKDSGISQFSELKGKKFVYGDMISTSAYAFPKWLLANQGCVDDEYFAFSAYTNDTGAALDLVLSGGYDAAAVKDTNLNKLLAENLRFKDVFAVIDEAGDFPDNVFMMSSNLTESLQLDVRSLLLDMDKSVQGEGYLKELNIDRFIETSVADYDAAAKIIDGAQVCFL
jgi:phosphonate transport system substrate-binding protein